MNLVIYGPEGSGKGTQAKLLSKKFSLPVITAGDLVREAAQKKGTSLGKLCEEVLTSGGYLLDSQMFLLVKDKLKSRKVEKGFILDGFPRNLLQAEFLLSLLAKMGRKLDKVIYLRLSDEEAEKRLLKRKRKLFGKSRILHDDPERIKRRLKIYREKEKNLLPYLKKKNLFLEVEANQPIKKVFDSIIERLSYDPS